MMGSDSLLDVVFNVPVDKVFAYSRGPTDPNVAQPGFRVVAPFGRRTLVGYVVGTRSEAPQEVAEIRAIERAVDDQATFDASTVRLARWVSKRYMCCLGEALATMLPSGRREAGIDESLADTDVIRDFELAQEQTSAIDRISKAREGAYYLHGVTGSGKTTVYLEIAKRTVERGQGVIYLVPEISLTHQVVDVLGSAFGEHLAVLHSGLRSSERLGEWLRVLRGEALVVVGARSAVFAPLKRLGLVIVDEEHETSYKSNSTPRYHARQVAMYRCSTERAILVMGSATPSVEAFHSMRTGLLTELSLPKRLSGGSMPSVEIVDMRDESSPLSRRLIAEIARTHQEGRQTILFLNRRGFAYFFHCRSCDLELRCRHCSVALTFHKERNRLVCHYCGYSQEPITACPECGSLDVGYSGFGTEKIEEEIGRMFPDLVTRRLDTDSVRRRSVLKRALDDFRKGKTDILLGTQMVAKGLNFPGVRLVGVVLADTSLHLPDFRAVERAFNLITQVAGRAGRTTVDGRVIVQTYRPEHEAIRLAATGRVEEFYQQELRLRKELRFPPFCRLVRVVVRGRDVERVRKAAGQFAASVEGSIGSDGDMLGPAECPIGLIAGNHRYHLILRGKSLSPLHRVVRKHIDDTRKTRGVYVEVDVDPVSLL